MASSNPNFHVRPSRVDRLGRRLKRMFRPGSAKYGSMEQIPDEDPDRPRYVHVPTHARSSFLSTASSKEMKDRNELI